MAQTTIQGSFLGDATVTGAKIGADFISAQTALSSGLATADELIVSDAGVIKKMAMSVWAATTITFTNKSVDLGTNTLTGSVAEFNTALQSESFATLGGTEVLVAKTLTSPVFNTGVSGTAILDEDNLATNSATQLATQQSIKAYADTKAPIAGATLTGTTQFATLSDGTIAVTAWVDEDNMGSNSATLIPTQQSVKAYVDANAGGDFYDTITNGTSKIYVDNNASSGFSLVNNYKFQINMPTSGEGFFFKCADQGSEHSAIFYADYPSQITKICGSSKWQPLVGGQTGSSGDGKFYIVCDANSRAIWIYNREGNDRTITVHGMGRIVSITAQVAI